MSLVSSSLIGDMEMTVVGLLIYCFDSAYRSFRVSCGVSHSVTYTTYINMCLCCVAIATKWWDIFSICRAGFVPRDLPCFRPFSIVFSIRWLGEVRVVIGNLLVWHY